MKKKCFMQKPLTQKELEDIVSQILTEDLPLDNSEDAPLVDSNYNFADSIHITAESHSTVSASTNSQPSCSHDPQQSSQFDKDLVNIQLPCSTVDKNRKKSRPIEKEMKLR